MVKGVKFQLHELIPIDENIEATIKVTGWEEYYK